MLKNIKFFLEIFFVVCELKEITDTIYELQSSGFSGSEFNEPIH